MNSRKLAIGNVVEFRNGNRAVVVVTDSSMRKSFLFPSEGVILIETDKIDEETLLSKIKPDYDVMKIFSMADPIRRLSEMNDSGKLTLICEREQDIKLTELTAKAFVNADSKVQKSYAGFTDIADFRGHKNYFQLELNNEAEMKEKYPNQINDESIKRMKDMFVQDMKDIINGKKLMSDSRLHFAMQTCGCQFERGAQMILVVKDFPELISPEGFDAHTFTLRMNDERIERLMTASSYRVADDMEMHPLAIPMLLQALINLDN